MKFLLCRKTQQSAIVSLPVRGAWVEMPFRRLVRPLRGSLPVRGAWVEMLDSCMIFDLNLVAPRAGSVG